MRVIGHRIVSFDVDTKKEAPMTRDELNNELRMHSATFPSVLIVYGTLVGTLVLSALAITA